MTQIINSAAGVGDHGHNPFHRDAETPAPQAEPAPCSGAVAEDADVRLIIEDDVTAGDFVYTTVDRRTGEVIRQLPRDRLVKLGEAADYAAGDVIKTRA